MSGARFEGLSVAEDVTLRSKGSFAPIEKSVRTKVGPVQIIPAALDGTAVEPNGPLIRNVVAIRVGELPNVRGRSDVCLLYTSPSPRDVEESRMPSSA